MNLRIRICSLVFILISTGLFGQEDDFVYGTIIDNETNEPVVFATVLLKGKAMGVISNNDGSFRVPRRFMNLGEMLVVSCLGYKNKRIMLSELSSDFNTQIRIEPKPVELKEAVLFGKRKRPPSPRKIIRRAIERIPQNYPVEPFSYVGYYRDYQLKENEYINLNEAILHIIDMGFEQNDLDDTRIQIYDYKANPDFKRDSLANRPYNYATKGKIIENAYLYDYGGNELNILRIHDAIRNYNIKTYSYVNRLNKDLINNHSLMRKQDVVLGDERMYVIALEKSRPELTVDTSLDEAIHADFRTEGTIYISQLTYAIHKLVYKMYDTTAGKNKSKSDAKLLFEVTVEYKRNEDRMYLNYISFHNVFTVRKSLFFIREVKLNMEEKCFVIRFNNEPTLYIDKTQPNFIIKYKKKRVKLKAMRRQFKDILLYPEAEQFDKISEELTTLYGNPQYFSPGVFEFNVVNIRDSNGNELRQYVNEEYNQFREFFTQQLISDTPDESAIYSLMIKDRPIFEDQPIIRPNNFDEYWMNTPLKSKQ